MERSFAVRRIICNNGGGGCHTGCGLLAYVDEATGRITKLEANPDHPLSAMRPKLCEDRVPHMLKWLYHKDQLLYPLKRSGKRGEGKWQTITWEKALDEIAEKVREAISKYGPECIGVSEGTYRSDYQWARARLLNLIGNPQNIADPGTICFCNGLAFVQATAGNYCHHGDYSLTNCAVLEGRNLPESFPALWDYLMRRKMQKLPVKIIAIDPRLTEAARNSDLWLQIRPGTDGALLLSWINIIMNENLYDRDFVEKWTNAPFLARETSQGLRMLRESDLNREGDHESFVVFDELTSTPATWNPNEMTYEPAQTKPVLDGSFKVRLVDGKSIECKTVWRLIKERVEKYTPEEAEKITWVPADKIVEGARMYATNKPGAWHWGVAVDHIGPNAIRVHNCRMILRSLTANVDVAGGDLLPEPGPIIDGKKGIREAHLQLEDKCPPKQKAKQLGIDQFKLLTWACYDITNPYYKARYGIPQNMSGHWFLVPAPVLWRTIITGKPYPIKTLITWSSNPMIWSANTHLVHSALKSESLDLHVVLDHVMTPTADLADYVLPAASKVFERVLCSTREDGSHVMEVTEQAIAPLGERRSDYFFWRELAIRLGYDEYFPWKDDKEVAEYRLKPLGISFEEAVKTTIIPQAGRVSYDDKTFEKTDPSTGKPKGFATPSRRVELYVSIFEQLGYDPLPFYEEPIESPIRTPVLAKEYPLILTTGGRFRPMFHSEYRHWGMGYREQHPDPLLEIHYATAKELGIADGDWVWIETKRGKIIMRARLSAGIHPQVVNAESHWWFPELPAEEPWLHGAWLSNTNLLTLEEPGTLDPTTGSWTNRALQCKVYRADHTPFGHHSF